MNEQEMNALADGRRLVNVMDDIKYEVERQMQAVKNRAFGSIRKGDFTPELAQQLWVEMYSAHKLMNSFQSRVNQGIATAEKHHEVLTIGE